MGVPYFNEAGNTLRASRWLMFWVRLLGRRITGNDGCYRVELAEFGGRRYLLSFRKDETLGRD